MGGTLVTAALAVVGATAMTLSVVGMLRLPDRFTRMHASSKAVVVGVVAILLGTTGTGRLDLMLRALLVACFILVTAPIGSQALAHAEHRLRCQLGDQGTEEVEEAD